MCIWKYSLWNFNVFVQVVNCVTEPAKRGEMLARCALHLTLVYLIMVTLRRFSESRLSAQIKNTTGVLLLVLPLRCVDSKHVGGTAGFDLLLQGLGLRELLPKRYTPRLVFYILGGAQHGELSGGDGWRAAVAATVSRCMDESTKKMFSRDYSEVPPTEFSVSLSADLLSHVSSKKSKR